MRQPVPIDNRAKFLSLVFRGTGAAFIEFRSLPSKARAFVRPERLDQTGAFVADHDREDVYFGVASRRDASSGRLENCEALGALFADIDFKLLCENAAREQIARFTLPPTIVVASGGGLHAYWTLTVPIDLRSQAASARSLLRRLAHAIGADVSAAEPARVLRVPDTMNFKYQPARPVRVETFEPRRQYTVSEFDRALPAEFLTPTAGIDAPPDGEHICEGQRNVMLYSIARSLRARKLTYEAIAGVVATVNSKLCVPPLDASEVKAIIASATIRPDRADFASKHRLVGNRASRVQVTVTLT